MNVGMSRTRTRLVALGLLAGCFLPGRGTAAPMPRFYACLLSAGVSLGYHEERTWQETVSPWSLRGTLGELIWFPLPRVGIGLCCADVTLFRDSYDAHLAHLALLAPTLQVVLGSTESTMHLVGVQASPFFLRSYAFGYSMQFPKLRLPAEVSARVGWTEDPTSNDKAFLAAVGLRAGLVGRWWVR